MANFFAKPKVSARVAPKEEETAIASSSKLQSDFGKSFKSFVLKKDTQLAPINWFLESEKTKGRSAARTDNSIIVIDDEDDPKEQDVEMQDIQVKDVDVTRLDAKGAYLISQYK
jgi:chromatin assembly factor 1 subunit A